METGLHGRCALITGAASGIGRAIAEALAREGALVVIADRNAEAGQAAAAQIQASGGTARAIHCDVADEESVAAAVASVVAQEGQLHVLVNNAGIGGTPGPLVRQQLDDWDRIYTVNLRGVFLGIKHGGLAMTGGGVIINIASVAGLAGTPMLGPYGATKAAVIQLTQTAAIELVDHRIRVNAICPGWIETAILGDFDRAALAKQVPMGRIGTPAEVASMAVYLASDAAAFVTGAVFRVDGGMKSL